MNFRTRNRRALAASAIAVCSALAISPASALADPPSRDEALQGYSKDVDSPVTASTDGWTNTSFNLFVGDEFAIQPEGDLAQSIDDCLRCDFDAKANTCELPGPQRRAVQCLVGKFSEQGSAWLTGRARVTHFSGKLFLSLTGGGSAVVRSGKAKLVIRRKGCATYLDGLGELKPLGNFGLERDRSIDRFIVGPHTITFTGTPPGLATNEFLPQDIGFGYVQNMVRWTGTATYQFNAMKKYLTADFVDPATGKQKVLLDTWGDLGIYYSKQGRLIPDPTDRPTINLPKTEVGLLLLSGIDLVKGFNMYYGCYFLNDEQHTFSALRGVAWESTYRGALKLKVAGFIPFGDFELDQTAGIQEPTELVPPLIPVMYGPLANGNTPLTGP